MSSSARSINGEIRRCRTLPDIGATLSAEGEDTCGIRLAAMPGYSRSRALTTMQKVLITFLVSEGRYMPAE